MTNRFIDNGNHTISDSLTGLMWQESYAYVETGNNISWYDAQGYIEKLNNLKLGGTAIGDCLRGWKYRVCMKSPCHFNRGEKLLSCTLIPFSNSAMEVVSGLRIRGFRLLLGLSLMLAIFIGIQREV